MAEGFLIASDGEEARLSDGQGLDLHGQWEPESAIQPFTGAAANDPDQPGVRLNLTRAVTMARNDTNAGRTLTEYVPLTKAEKPANGSKRLFRSDLGAVESKLLEGMSALALPVQLMGKAFQMWLDYRQINRRQAFLVLERPAVWACALVFLTCLISLQNADRPKIADQFQVDIEQMTNRCNLICKTPDLTAADLRYFHGGKSQLEGVFENVQFRNPLNKRLEPA